MKRLVLFLFLSLNQIFYSQIEWQNIGPGGGSDLHFMAIQPDNADIIFVGGDIEGIFKTTNFGQTWKSVNNNLAQSNYGGGQYWINDIVFDPSDYQRIFICTAVGLFKSENSAESWELLFPANINNEDDPIGTSAVAIDPTNHDIIYLGLGDATDGSFADFKPFVDYDEATGLFKSSDGGKSWIEIGQNITENRTIHSIVINPSNPKQIVIATTKGLFRSTNGGSDWIELNNGLPHTNIHRLKGNLYSSSFHLYLTVKVLGTNGNAASFSGGIFTSTDMGDSWTNITSNLPKYDSEEELFYDYWKLDVHPTNSNIIYTATVRGSGFEEPGIYVTKNGGDNWELIHMQHEVGWLNKNWFWEPYPFDIKIAPSNPKRIVACWDWVETSKDGGVTWNQKYTIGENGAWSGNGLELMNTDCIAFHPTNKDVYFVGYDDMGLFRSDNSGTSFYRLDETMDPTIGSLSDIDGIKDIRIDPDNGDLYISRWQGSQGGFLADYTAGGIVFSSDMGNNVSEISNGLPLGRCDLILDTSSGSTGNRILYSAVFNHGVYKTINSGESWTPINNNLGSEKEKVWEIAINPNNSQNLYLGLNSRGSGAKNLYSSEDGGQNWALINNFHAGDILAIFIDQINNIYVSLTDNFDWNYSGGLYLSEDGGDTWNIINDHPRIIDISVHPNNPNLIVTAGQPFYKPDLFGGRVDISKDGGSTWEEISSGMGHTFLNFAQFDPHDQSKIYAGTAGGGLWITNLATDVKDSGSDLPNHFELYQNYPNPFNPSTTISFGLKEEGYVTLSIFNILGERVALPVNKNMNAGLYSVNVNFGNFASGIYIYRIDVKGKFTDVKKMILLR